MLHLVWGLCAFVTKGLLTRHLCERSMWKNSSNWLCVNWAHYWSAFCFSCDSNLNRSNYLKSVRPNAAFFDWQFDLLFQYILSKSVSIRAGLYTFIYFSIYFFEIDFSRSYWLLKIPKASKYFKTKGKGLSPLNRKRKISFSASKNKILKSCYLLV